MGDFPLMKTLDDIVVYGKLTAVIVYDVIKDICEDGFAYDRNGWGRLDRMPILEMVDKSLVPFVRHSKGKIPIVFVNSEYSSDEFKDDPYPIINFCIAGTEGVKFYHLDPQDASRVFTKHHWSALLQHPYEEQKPTELHKWLQRHGITKQMITGITSTHCIPINVEHAVQLGYQVILLRDLIAARAERLPSHNENIKKYEEHNSVLVVNSSQIKYIAR